MNRGEAINLLKENLRNEHLIKHSLAVEAAMIALARHFGEDSEKWGLTGLLHDIDYEQTKQNPEEHSLIGAKMLEEKGVSGDIVEAVKTHNQLHGIEPESLMARSLFCADPLTGLIVASVLVLPDSKIKNLTINSLEKRFKEKSFARSADREIISRCQDYLELELEDFMKIVLNGMQSISDSLGL